MLFQDQVDNVSQLPDFNLSNGRVGVRSGPANYSYLAADTYFAKFVADRRSTPE